MQLPRLTLVLGGANSGKSLFAENLVTASGLDRLYIATAEAHDEEMRVKIRAHRDRRGLGWGLVEAPLDLSDALMDIGKDQIALVDCLSFFLSNHLLKGSDLARECDGLIAALRGLKRPTVLVSNEVGMGVVPDTALGRAFRSAQGGLNQRVAEIADLVVVVMAGLPLLLKGKLPS